MPYADFARVFGPQGLLDGFFRSRLAGQVDTRTGPGASPAGPPDRAVQATLRSFEMADDIRRLFFPAGAVLPQLRLQLTPVSMDAELLFFSADVDGQLLRYENGPRRPKALVWPGPAGTQRVLLRILPPGPRRRRRGARGALGLAAGAAAARLAARQRRVAVGETGGRRPRTEGRSHRRAPVGAGLLDELKRFRCPEAW